MKQALVIKTDALLPNEIIAKYQKLFTEQLKTGVVIIPAFFQAELINVPTDVEVVIETGTEHEFLEKRLNIKKE